MAAVKVTSALCLSLLVMTLLLAPSCGNKEACDEWSSNTYEMLLLCSSKTCSKRCIGEGATRGKCGFLISGPSASAPKNATEQSHLTCNVDLPFQL